MRCMAPAHVLRSDARSRCWSWQQRLQLCIVGRARRGCCCQLTTDGGGALGDPAFQLGAASSFCVGSQIESMHATHRAGLKCTLLMLLMHCARTWTSDVSACYVCTRLQLQLIVVCHFAAASSLIRSRYARELKRRAQQDAARLIETRQSRLRICTERKAHPTCPTRLRRNTECGPPKSANQGITKRCRQQCGRSENEPPAWPAATLRLRGLQCMMHSHAA